jgi:hypothetical protein
VPAHFWQDQNTFGGPRTLLTSDFTFGISETLLERSRQLWKPQNTAGTVPALLAPLFLSEQRPNPANTGMPHFTPF